MGRLKSGEIGIAMIVSRGQGKRIGCVGNLVFFHGGKRTILYDRKTSLHKPFVLFCKCSYSGTSA